MGTELEEAGALVSAGLAAHEIDRASSGARAGPPGAICSNCGTALAGRFCHACGQPGRLHRSLLHLVEEALHAVLHFDSKGWRTLPLLIARPGVLTRRYIDGQRASFVSPLALFLFCVFLMFFVFSWLAPEPTVLAPSSAADRSAARAELAQAADEAKAELAQAQDALAQARSAADGVGEAEQEVNSARIRVRATEFALRMFDAAQPKAGGGAQRADAAASAPGKTWQQKAAELSVDTGSKALDDALRRQLRNPDLFLYKLKNTAYKFSFMLIPISLPFLWLMFLGRPGVALYDHAVFSLYSLSFMSLLFIAFILLSNARLGALAAMALLVVPPVHMFAQVRQTYGLSVAGALWRTVALLVIAGTAFLLFLLFIIAVAMR